MVDTLTILQSDFVVNMLLPFLLVFTLVFAVLQKSKIFGEGKRQIDALVSLAVALIFVSVGRAVGIVTGLIPFLAVALVIILVFLLLVSFSFKEGEFELPNQIKIALGVIAAIALVVAVVYITNFWTYLTDLFTGKGSALLTNVVFIVIVVAAVIAVVWGGGKGGGKPSGS